MGESRFFSCDNRITPLPPIEIIYLFGLGLDLCRPLWNLQKKKRMIWYTRLSVAPRLDKQYFSPCSFTISRL